MEGEEVMKPKCLKCGNEFEPLPGRRVKRFCSIECSRAFKARAKRRRKAIKNHEARLLKMYHEEAAYQRIITGVDDSMDKNSDNVSPILEYAIKLRRDRGMM